MIVIRFAITYLLHYFQHLQEVILSQITYGNMPLIVLSFFQGYKKKKYLQIIEMNQMYLNAAIFSVTSRSISSIKIITHFYLIF
jgi:hypothetical protein